MTPLGMTAATTGINVGGNAIGNLLGAGLNQFFWDRQAEKSFRLNEKSADNAQQRTIDLYNLLQSPKAMVEQLKEAGLSKSLMYGKGGIGGQVASAPQGTGTNGMMGADIKGMGRLLDPLTMAQIANIEADTKKKTSETKKTNQETETEKWFTKVNEFNSKLLSIDFDLKDSTMWQRYNTILFEMHKVQGEAMKALSEGSISQETYDNQIRMSNLTIKATEQAIKMNETLEKKYGSEIKLNNSLATKAYAEKNQIVQYTKNLQEEFKKITEDTKLKIAQTKSEEERKLLIQKDKEYKERLIQESIDKYDWQTFSKEDAKFLISEGLDFGANFIPANAAGNVAKAFAGGSTAKPNYVTTNS